MTGRFQTPDFSGFKHPVSVHQFFCILHKRTEKAGLWLAWKGTLKTLLGSPKVGQTFFSLPAHPCTVTYMTEILSTKNNQQHSLITHLLVVLFSFLRIYCEILFIRGDPIFVVFVVGLAHEFTIPRIMNTTYVPQIDICTFLKKKSILVCVHTHIC